MCLKLNLKQGDHSFCRRQRDASQGWFFPLGGQEQEPQSLSYASHTFRLPRAATCSSEAEPFFSVWTTGLPGIPVPTDQQNICVYMCARGSVFGAVRYCRERCRNSRRCKIQGLAGDLTADTFRLVFHGMCTLRKSPSGRCKRFKQSFQFLPHQ